MELPFRLLVLFATLSIALARQEPQIAPQQQVPEGRTAPLLGIRYSASTDVSHTSYSSPLVTYGDSLNEIQLPAAPIQPANLRQVYQEDQPDSDSEEEQSSTFTKGGDQVKNQQLQAQYREPHNQLTQAIQPKSTPQFISIQQYPARPQLRRTPSGFSLNQNLPGPQIATRAQYQSAEAQSQYATAQPQPYVSPQHNVAQQYASPAADVAPQQQQPVQYSSPSSNTYFATGPFTNNLVARQYPAPGQTQYAPPVAPQYVQQVPSQYAQPLTPQYAPPVAPQYAQQVASQYAQPVAPQYAQQVASQYAQPVAPQYAQQVASQYAQPVAPQYAQQVASQYAQPVAQRVQGQYAQPVGAAAPQYPAQSEHAVAKVSFSSPVAGFSYGF